MYQAQCIHESQDLRLEDLLSPSGLFSCSQLEDLASELSARQIHLSNQNVWRLLCVLSTNDPELSVAPDKVIAQVANELITGVVKPLAPFWMEGVTLEDEGFEAGLRSSLNHHCYGQVADSLMDVLAFTQTIGISLKSLSGNLCDERRDSGSRRMLEIYGQLPMICDYIAGSPIPIRQGSVKAGIVTVKEVLEAHLSWVAASGRFDRELKLRQRDEFCARTLLDTICRSSYPHRRDTAKAVLLGLFGQLEAASITVFGGRYIADRHFCNLLDTLGDDEFRQGVHNCYNELLFG